MEKERKEEKVTFWKVIGALFVLILVGLILTTIFGSGLFWLKFLSVIAVLIIVTSFIPARFGPYKTAIGVVVVIFYIAFEGVTFMKVHRPMTLAGGYEANANHDMKTLAKLYEPGTRPKILLLNEVRKAEDRRTEVLKDSIRIYLEKSELGALPPEDSTKLANWLIEQNRFTNQVKGMMELSGIKVAPDTTVAKSPEQARVDTVIVPADRPLSPSPFYVQQGQSFEFTVVGQWNCATQGPCQPGPCNASGQDVPKCATDRDKYPGGNNPVHNLMVYIGDTPIKIEMRISGDGVIITGKAPVSGPVLFGPNDWFVQDNTGQLSVIGKT